jgi:hypothetical protein
MTASPPTWPFPTLADAAAEGVIAGFSDTHRWLSNFTGPVTAYGLAFSSVESAYVASKLTPPSPDSEQDGRAALDVLASALSKPSLLTAPTPKGATWLALQTIATLPPGQAKKIGRRLPLRADWEQERPDGLLVKEWTLLTLNRRKYAANPDLRRALHKTGDALILEGNTWGDTTWGVIDTKSGVVGFNRMGSIAMAVREELGGHGVPALAPAAMPRFAHRGLDAPTKPTPRRDAPTR